MATPGAQLWLDRLWTTLVATRVDPSIYYRASVQLQVMITASNNHLTP